MQSSWPHVVIVNWRGAALTEETVASLRACPGYDGSRVLIVDNGSGDGSVERLRVSCGDCEIIASERNLGFAGGCNVGIRRALAAGAESVLLLNNDTEVRSNFLEPLLTASAGGRVLATPRIVYASDPTRVWYGGGYVDRHRGGFYHETGAKASSTPRDVSFASGCCLLIPVEAFRLCGFLDEAFFLYYEDADFCLRVQEAGFRIRYVPESVIAHKVSASVGGMESAVASYYGTRNRIALMRRFGFSSGAWTFVVLSRLLKLMTAPWRPGRRSILSGIADGMRMRLGERCLA